MALGGAVTSLTAAEKEAAAGPQGGPWITEIKQPAHMSTQMVATILVIPVTVYLGAVRPRASYFTIHHNMTTTPAVFAPRPPSPNSHSNFGPLNTSVHQELDFSIEFLFCQSPQSLRLYQPHFTAEEPGKEGRGWRAVWVPPLSSSCRPPTWSLGRADVPSFPG